MNEKKSAAKSWQRCTAMCVVAVIAIVVYFSISHQHRRHEALNNLEMLCEVSEVDMVSKIWSHRAALDDIDPTTDKKRSTIDGSVEVTTELLNAGVSNYDVDISMTKLKDNSWSYVVAHPSRLAAAVKKQQQGKFQTVGAFLQQIAAKHPDLPARGHPMVSIEPKFNDPARIRELVQEVVNHAGAIAARTHIVASDDQVLQAIHDAMRRVSVPSGLLLPGVALAYRSKLSGAQFRWKDRQQHVDQYYQQLDNDEAAVRAHRPRRLILMPDIVLLTQSSTYLAASSRDNSPSDRDVLLVTWIVDTEKELARAVSLSPNINGMVSNHPMDLLQLLKEHHFNHCHRTPVVKRDAHRGLLS